MNINELREICQKEKLKRNTGLTLCNRKISIYITWLLVRLNISANQASVCGIFLGVAGSLLFIPGKWSLNFAGVFLLYLSFTCDQIDGELARYYKTVNLNGVYLDEIRHLVIYSITIFCLSFSAAIEIDSNIPFLIGFFGAMVLVIGRIEERLPKFIFTDKVILKDNFTGGTFVKPAKNNNKNVDRISDTNKRSIFKKLFSLLFYRGFNFLSNQVTILVWLFSVTIFDHFIFHDNVLFNYYSVQSIVFYIFSFLGFLTTSWIIYGHFKSNKIEKDCNRIYLELAKIVR